jgi:hypothetical protein
MVNEPAVLARGNPALPENDLHLLVDEGVDGIQAAGRLEGRVNGVRKFAKLKPNGTIV